jgi:hypothetical protein
MLEPPRDDSRQINQCLRFERRRAPQERKNLSPGVTRKKSASVFLNYLLFLGDRRGESRDI